MKAMILAAGLGTRLRPLTDRLPKALVKVGERTLLEIALSRLHEFGVREAVVNVHHFAGMILEYLKANDNFGMSIAVSPEEVLLDTGGGLKKAAWFFCERDPSPHQANNGLAGDPDLRVQSHAEEPFILHNVDVVSTINLRRMAQFHREHQALATLAVQERPSSRLLLFDGQSQLRGRQADKTGTLPHPEPQTLPPPAHPLNVDGATHPLAFSGIHIISPRMLDMMEDGVYSIIDTYLRLAEQGEKILGFRADEYYWRDLGTPESLRQAEQDAKQKLFF